jgi:hypothetical protein
MDLKYFGNMKSMLIYEFALAFKFQVFSLKHNHKE